MSLTDAQRDAFAKALFDTDRSQSQIPLISQQHPGLDMEDAYAIQAALVRRFVDAGRVIRGWKIGLTSKAMQYALDIDIPDSGVLFEDMFFDNAGEVPTARFMPRIGRNLLHHERRPARPGVTAADVIAATESVCPSLEILDTRIIPKDPDTGAIRKVTDTINDNANAGIVLGDERHAIDALICAGLAPSSAATARSRKPVWARACSTTRWRASSGWPTGWRSTATRSAPATWCSAARSYGRCRPPRIADRGRFRRLRTGFCRFV